MRMCTKEGCNFTFKNDIDYLKHARAKHKWELHTCTLCRETVFFKTPDALIAHHRTFHTHGRHTCPFCPAGFKTVRELKRHISSGQSPQHRVEVGYEKFKEVHDALPKATAHGKIKEFGPVAKNGHHKTKRYENGTIAIEYDTEEFKTLWTCEVLGKDNAVYNLSPKTLEEVRCKKDGNTGWSMIYKVDLDLDLIAPNQASIQSLHDYDCGHLVAAANHQNNDSNYLFTFWMYNIVAMQKDLNKSTWLSLENHVRRLIKKWCRVVVFTVPVYHDSSKNNTVGGSVVHIPSEFFKIIILEHPQINPRLQVFRVKNTMEDCYKSPFMLQSSLQEVYAATGYRFLSNVNIEYTWQQKFKFQCDNEECEQLFEHEHELKEHTASHLIAFTCPADQCKEIFLTESNMKEHAIKCHTLFSCEWCEFTTYSNNRLMVHAVTHSRITKTTCLSCHSKKRLLVCQTCTAKVKNENDLRWHLKEKHGLKNVLQMRPRLSQSTLNKTLWNRTMWNSTNPSLSTSEIQSILNAEDKQEFSNNNFHPLFKQLKSESGIEKTQVQDFDNEIYTNASFFEINMVTPGCSSSSGDEWIPADQKGCKTSIRREKRLLKRKDLAGESKKPRLTTPLKIADLDTRVEVFDSSVTLETQSLSEALEILETRQPQNQQRSPTTPSLQTNENFSISVHEPGMQLLRENMSGTKQEIRGELRDSDKARDIDKVSTKASPPKNLPWIGRKPSILTLEQNFACDVCSKKFKDKYTLRRHKKIHADGDKSETIQCENCESIFHKRSKFNLHQNLCNWRKNGGVKKATVKNYLTCDSCDIIFKTKKAYKQHVDIIHSFNQCPHCGMEKADVENFEQHISSCVQRKEVSKRCFLCPTNSWFATEEVYNRHLAQFHASCMCPYCEEKCRNTASMDAHLRTCKKYKEIKPYACLICCERFKTISSYRVHERRHDLRLQKKIKSSNRNEEADTVLLSKGVRKDKVKNTDQVKLAKNRIPQQNDKKVYDYNQLKPLKPKDAQQGFNGSAGASDSFSTMQGYSDHHSNQENATREINLIEQIGSEDEHQKCNDRKQDMKQKLLETKNNKRMKIKAQRRRALQFKDFKDIANMNVPKVVTGLNEGQEGRSDSKRKDAVSRAADSKAAPKSAVTVGDVVAEKTTAN